MEQDEALGRDAVNLRAASWVVRQALGTLTPAEQAALDVWLREDPAHEVAFERESAVWERTERLRALRPQGPVIDDLLLSRNEPKAARQAVRRWSEPWRIAAAAVLCVAVAGGGFFWVGDGSKAYATAVGERRVVVLGDGSRIELNTDTRLSVRLTATGRRVKLIKGEALFDVRTDKTRPFTVAAENEVVRAVGTAFTVRLDREAVKVLVVKGEVEIEGRAGPQEIPFAVRLPAGAIGTYGAQGAVSRATAAGEADRTLSWRYGAISLAGETLDEAAAEFNRYNTKQLVVADRPTGALRLGGYFQQTDVDGFARALQSGFDVKVTDTGQALYLSRRPAAAPQPARGAPPAT